MPGPIDDTLKQLTELSPQDWVERGGWPAAAATLIDADIATISGAADKAIRVTGTPDWLLSVDFQSGHDALAKLPDLLLYNSALFKRHGLLVRTLLVLLHRRADSPQLTGSYERGFPGELFDVALRYRIIRTWEIPAEEWLSGGFGLVPLAPLGDVVEAELPALVAHMKLRIDREAPRRARELWSAAYILMGLRYERPLIETLLRGIANMKESVTYQAILEEGEAIGEAKGKAAEARRMLLLMGRNRFGEPSVKVVAALDAVSDVTQLEELGVRLLHALSWEELLGLNGPTRRTRGRKK
jgi:predicted transposase YdaD